MTIPDWLNDQGKNYSLKVEGDNVVAKKRGMSFEGIKNFFDTIIHRDAYDLQKVIQTFDNNINDPGKKLDFKEKDIEKIKEKLFYKMISYNEKSENKLFHKIFPRKTLLEPSLITSSNASLLPRSSLVPIYRQNREKYPTVFEQRVTEKDVAKRGFVSKTSQKYNQIQSINDYFKAVTKKGDHPFGNGRNQFDVHDRGFQDLAIGLLKQGIPSTRGKEERIAVSMLIRAKNYAIASRGDLDWHGEKASSEVATKKSKILRENSESLVLRDWAKKEIAESEKQPGSKKTEISIVLQSTRDATLEMVEANPDEKVCWVNFANAHKTGGGYQIGCNAQEEETATACDSIVVLGNVSEIDPFDNRVTYKNGWHIPAGGNYFHRTHFFTDKEPVECYTIVQPFADFRDRSFAERKNFIKDGITDKPKKEDIENPNLYIARIKFDMRSVLRTAKEEKIDRLVLGASGCGAFEHVPELEAEAWKEVLEEPEFRGHFTEIRFAILGKKNLQAFQKGLQM